MTFFFLMNLAESLCVMDFPGGPVVKNPLANAGTLTWIPHALRQLSPCATTTGAHERQLLKSKYP